MSLDRTAEENQLPITNPREEEKELERMNIVSELQVGRYTYNILCFLYCLSEGNLPPS